MALDIQKHFPKHSVYIEPFFGAGGMFFNKPKAKYNIVNDLDSDVFNFFQVVMNNKTEFEDAFYQMPIHSDLLKYWLDNKETEPIKKALRFMFLSNYTFLGNGSGTLYFGAGGKYTTKDNFFKDIKKCFDKIYDIQLNNIDFREFLKNISFHKDGRDTEAKTLIYADPPYLGTNDNYSHSFTEQDSIDLFDCLQERACNFAMSEFDNEFILTQANTRKLNVIYIGERQNLKNRRTEILITNYENAPTLFS